MPFQTKYRAIGDVLVLSGPAPGARNCGPKSVRLRLCQPCTSPPITQLASVAGREQAELCLTWTWKPSCLLLVLAPKPVSHHIPRIALHHHLLPINPCTPPASRSRLLGATSYARCHVNYSLARGPQALPELVPRLPFRKPPPSQQATITMPGLVSATGVLAFLADEEPELKVFALQTLNDDIDTVWTEVAGALSQMCVLPQAPSASLGRQAKGFSLKSLKTRQS